MLLSDDSAQFEATHIGQHHIQDGRIHLLLIHELKRISRIVASNAIVFTSCTSLVGGPSPPIPCNAEQALRL